MLTDVDCRNARCPQDKKRHRLTDGAGLYLEVSPSGSKRWFWKFYPQGKESRLALGRYPNLSLKAAREARDEARSTRQSGANPVQRRKVERLAATASSATTFEAVARELHGLKTGTAWGPAHAAQWLRTCEKDLFPRIGALPLADIAAPLLLDALKRVQARGASQQAHDLREYAGQVFRHGIATGRCKGNPAADLIGALRPHVVRSMAAVLDPKRTGELLRAIDGYIGQPTTRAALALSALLFQRPGNMRSMEWTEVDLDAALWSIPAVKMKRRIAGKLNGRPHLVPLPAQAVTILRDLYPLTGHGRFVFPGQRSHDRPMSENTVNAALRYLGYPAEDHSAHGFRAMARTLISERLPGVAPDVIEAQLAHGKSGPLGMAYDRAEYMEERRRLMTEWADYLDRLRDGARVIALKGRRA